MNRVSGTGGDPIEAPVAGQVACLAGSHLAIYEPLDADRFGLDTWAISMAATGAGAAKERKNASLDFIGDPVAGPNSRPPSLGLVRLEYGTGLPRMGPAGHIQLGGWRAIGIDRLVGVG